MKILCLLLLTASAYGASFTNAIISPNGKVEVFRNYPWESKTVVHTVGGAPVKIDSTSVYLNTTIYWIDGAPYIEDPGNPPALVSFALPDIAVTEPTTSYPVSFADFTPTVTNVVVPALAPQIAEWTRQNDPGDTMALTGESLELGYAGFHFYSEAASGFGDIQRIDGRLAAITLPSTLTADDMYLMWAMNTNGFGEPVGINKTEAWWLGSDLIATGETFSIYGRNMDLGDGLAQAYIEGYGWITNNGTYNPYKVDFVVPALTNGTYTVYAHNGHGQKYGWADPMIFEVEDKVIWNDTTSTWINVTDAPYNATGDGVTDDTTAIQAALAATGVNGTTHFPTGEYLITSQINVGTQKRMIGDGMDLTLIQAHPTDFVGDQVLGLSGYSRLESLEVNKGNLGLIIIGRKSAIEPRIRVHNVRASALYSGANPTPSAGEENAIYWSGCRNSLITDSEFIIASGFYGSSEHQQVFSNTAFYGLNDQNTLIGHSGYEVAMIDCYASPYDNSDTSEGLGWAKGRWVQGGGVANKFYIGGNASTNMTPRDPTPFYTNAPIAIGTWDSGTEVQVLTFADIPTSMDGRRGICVVASEETELDIYNREYYLVADGSEYAFNAVSNTATVIFDLGPLTTNYTFTMGFKDYVDQNSGEQFMWESLNVYHRGSPSVINSSTNLEFVGLDNIIVSGDNVDMEGYTFAIVEGRGMGQTSKIVDDATTTNGVVHLVTPLRVLPDTSSICKMGKFLDRVVLYDNDLAGTPDAGLTARDTATAGINVWGGSSKIIVDGNTFHDVEQGMGIWSLSGYEGSVTDQIQPNMFHTLQNNTIYNTQYGIFTDVNAYESTDASPDMTYFGNVFRNNSISNSSRAAFVDSVDGRMRKDMVIFEGNTAISNAANYELDAGSTNLHNQIWIGNTFTGQGSDTGLVFSVTNSPALQGNTYANFGASYAENLPGAVVELPVRTGDTNGGSFVVLNSGTASTELIALGQTNTITAESSATYTYPASVATNYAVGDYTFYVLGTPLTE